MSEPIPPFAPYRTPLEPASNFAAARVTPFDLTGPLPSGTVVLQASAGTGKTYALAALATRYIAEGVTTLPGLLLVTFTHIATGELRSRVYDRLLQCHSALSAALHDETVPDNAVDKLLATAAPAIVSERLQRVTEALASIDLATIATIHQFAGQMLTELGALAAHDAFDQFVEDLTYLKHQVAADLYLEVASQPQNHLAQLPYPEFQHLITQALENNTVALTASDGNTALQATVAQARSEYRRRKAALRVYGFNDIMERLRQTLSEPDTQRAADTLARRFPVVLVDEFQDTDPEQWDILRHAFLGRSTLVLIGDPKQAIYRFRGADVFAYLEAVRAADAEYTLPTNYRADAPLVAAVSELFATANLGTPEQPITVPPVDAYHAGSRLRTVGDGAPGAAGVGDDTPTVAEPPLLPAAEIRVIDASQALPVTAARKRIDNDLCRVTAQLLANSRLIRAGGITTQLRPDDIAVLVSRNRRAEEIRDALTSAGIPAAIVSGARSVLLSDAAAAWLTLLEAVADATPTRVSRLALGPLVALSAAAIAADADLLPSLRAGLAAATSSFPSSGANGLLEWLRTDYDLTPRIMSLPDGERMLTDIRHLAEILDAVPGHLSAADLANWLAEHMRSERRSLTGDRSRRLESGRPAVQILTVHAAKGLEFPVVLLPEAADQYYNVKKAHEPGVVIHHGSERLFDVSITPSAEVETLFKNEERADTARKLYVAATRAASRLVLWWAPTAQNLSESGLQLLLSGADNPVTAHPDTSGLSPDLFTVTVVPDVAPPSHEPDPPSSRILTARHFDRAIDYDWNRTSYSGITAGLHGFVSESGEPQPDDARPDEPDEPDEPDDSDTPELISPEPLATPEPIPSPLADMPAGTLFGTIVHEALEHLDPRSGDLEQSLSELCHRFAAAHPLANLNPEKLTIGLLQVLHTPLGTLAPGKTLADFGSSDRLAELLFEMPVGSGGAGSSRMVSDLAALFSDPALTPASDPLQPYGQLLAATPAATKVLSGFLTGSIDVVLRLAPTGFVILDYKTNKFPTPDGRPLLATDYTPAAMARAMMRAHYPLQALLYAVALRRHLSGRLPAADPDTLLAGVGYLFIRGMAGPKTPLYDGNPCGVFVWRPTPALVRAADAVLRGEA